MTDPNPNQVEVVIKKGGGREYMNLGRMSAWLTLTNHHLIVERMLGKNSSYPLSHLSWVGLLDYTPPLGLMSWKLLQAKFDSGESILFGTSDQQSWVQAIQQAKINAPEMPYTTVSSPGLVRSGQTPSAKPVIILALAALGLILLTLCMILLTIGAILLMRAIR